MSNPIDSVLNWYAASRDCMRITGRVMRKNLRGAVTRSDKMFYRKSISEINERLTEVNWDLENLTLVAMVAVFERTLRVYFIGLVVPHLPSHDEFGEAIQEQVENDILFWHLSGRVIDEVFKKRVSSDLCGMVKQIINRRNEVAHGHVLGQPPPVYAKPATVYKRLTNFLTEADILK